MRLHTTVVSDYDTRPRLVPAVWSASDLSETGLALTALCPGTAARATGNAPTRLRSSERGAEGRVPPSLLPSMTCSIGRLWRKRPVAPVDKLSPVKVFVFARKATNARHAPGCHGMHPTDEERTARHHVPVRSKGVPCKKIEPLRSCVRLRRQLSLRLLETCAAMVDYERDELRFALAALNWYHSHAC